MAGPCRRFVSTTINNGEQAWLPACHGVLASLPAARSILTTARLPCTAAPMSGVIEGPAVFGDAP